MGRALVVSVGTTAEPIIRSVDEISGKEEARLFMIYGRAFQDQPPPTPFDVAQRVKEHAESKGIGVEIFEAPKPDDLDSCLEVARDVLRRCARYEEVIVDYTGGTKVLAAALVHAALTAELGGRLTLRYISGRRGEDGRVKEEMEIVSSERTLTQEICSRVLERLRSCDYSVAFYLATRLPDMGRAGFIRRAAEALWLWDNFDYRASTEIIRKLSEPARMFLDDGELGKLAGTMRRLLEVSGEVSNTAEALRDLCGGGGGKRRPSGEGMRLLCADALENGWRRAREGRFTDAVLRAYRALEVAVQTALLERGISPWGPNWEAVPEEVREAFLNRFGRLPDDIALFAGMTLWSLLEGKELSDEEERKFKDLGRIRNLSYLEHGYLRCDAEAAERAIAYAQELAEKVLGAELGGLRERVRHEV